MSIFKLFKPYKPAGDQPKAIAELTKLLKSGEQHQTLLGVTGSGKTFTMANVIANLGRPALVISHNKTLAAQLYQEFKTFFPENAVHYFVSYYDYYQPEAYIPHSDTYIEKDAKINDFIDAMRHATTASALTRKDFVIIASVSCIYGIGDPKEYEKAALEIKEGMNVSQKELLKKLVKLRYERNDYEQRAGLFRVRGETVEIFSPAADKIIRVEWDGNVIEKISQNQANFERLTLPRKVSGGSDTHQNSLDSGLIKIFPAKHFVTPQEKLDAALKNIELELGTQLLKFRKEGKILESERLRQRTNFDLKMLKETGFVHGIENYSRHLSFRKEGEAPYTLLDFLPTNFLTFIDESHMTVPQIRGMYNGDRARKEVLVNYGFRLPSAMDNRPLKFEEFDKKVGQIVYVSATPAEYEL
ncbi:DEAD/DEAH box helicase family protein, partial [Candidatus Giovannonibacteria bacterium]|nr:DEAD/DEAH box helicase family protein [Candidatus Giovannonibacteria bacterium]